MNQAVIINAIATALGHACKIEPYRASAAGTAHNLNAYWKALARAEALLEPMLGQPGIEYWDTTDDTEYGNVCHRSATGRMNIVADGDADVFVCVQSAGNRVVCELRLRFESYATLAVELTAIDLALIDGRKDRISWLGAIDEALGFAGRALDVQFQLNPLQRALLASNNPDAVWLGSILHAGWLPASN